jgi:RNA polymerase-binding protein DksA
MQPDRYMGLDHRIKVLLVARQRALLDRYDAELARVDEELEAHDSERVGKAAERYDAQLLLRMSEADERILTELASAIRRFDEGEYGRCVDCGNDIAARRLAALPEAALCFLCAVRAEQPARPPSYSK